MYRYFWLIQISFICLIFHELFLDTLVSEKESYNRVKREMESTLAEIQEMSV